VRTALALQLQLRALEAVADLVITDLQRCTGWRLGRILQRRLLRIAEVGQWLGSSGVVSVAVDDHRATRLAGTKGTADDTPRSQPGGGLPDSAHMGYGGRP